MSENWPGNWYRDEEPGQPQAGAPGSSSARAQPRYAPDQGGSAPDDKWGTGWGSAWPSQPPPRSGRSGPGGPIGPSGPSGWRRWLRPKRILTIIAALVALAVVATVAVYFSVNSKLTK